eukprot:c9151_g1_i1.p1 GENE.c9151_g1_i1~~c9151_g1_i1.p1  ORF type:complete len:556 (-),score=72.28 c9151_g1_i1:79-1746(-)
MASERTRNVHAYWPHPLNRTRIQTYLHDSSLLLPKSVVTKPPRRIKKFSLLPCWPSQTSADQAVDSSSFPITSLPDDVLRGIFKNLDTKTKAACSLVCKDWCMLLRDALLWSDELIDHGVKIPDVWQLLQKHGWDHLLHLKLVGNWNDGLSRVWGWLRQCKSLQYLDVSNCTVDGILATQISSKHLTHLIANRTSGLDDRVLQTMFLSSSSLKTLCLEESPITDISLDWLAENCFKLECLSIRWSHFITDVGVQAITKHCTQLHSIDFSGCCSNVTNVALFDIARNLTTTLRILDMSWCAGVTDIGVTVLAMNCPNIKILRLSMCRRVTDEGVMHLARNCHELEELSLAGCRHVGDKSVALLATQCHRLHTLDLVWCGGITNHGMLHLAKRWSSRRLRSLGLNGCRSISDLALSRLGDGCPALLSLELEGCESITDLGAVFLARACRLIRHLNLSRCPQISDSALKAIAKHCEFICVLKLCGCQKVTDVGVGLIVSRCVHLRSLHLTGCGGVTITAFNSLASRRLRLNELDVRGCAKIGDVDAAHLVGLCDHVWH